MTTQKTLEIGSILMEVSNFVGQPATKAPLPDFQYNLIQHAIKQNRPLKFLLPAFPAKSANRRKTFSKDPDFGEVSALVRLNALCSKLSAIHSPGAQMIICSDGRVFNDLVGVEDVDVTTYGKGLKDIVKNFGLSYVSFFDLEDVMGESEAFTEMRTSLELNYGHSISDIRRSVVDDTKMKNLFNGIHRFIKEDYFIIHNHLSRNQVDKTAKQTAYKVIQRSNAWGSLVEQVYPEGFRLSIHPQMVGSEKFPIRLLPGTDQWGTPWHRVAYVDQGMLSLVRHCEAIERGGAVKMFQDRYVYFERATA